MHRRRALVLFATAVGVSVSSQAHAFADLERLRNGQTAATSQTSEQGSGANIGSTLDRSS
jgi:hypothetical protein